MRTETGAIDADAGKESTRCLSLEEFFMKKAFDEISNKIDKEIVSELVQIEERRC